MRHLVVARYQEDVSWLDRVPAGWKHRIVEKGVDLPNEGREASSYLLALHELYDSLRERDLVACVQGEPFVHCPDLVALLSPRRTVRRFEPLGNWRVICDGDGAPHHPGLPVAETYERLIGPWPGVVAFTAGAQFLLTGHDVHRFSKQTYQFLMSETTGNGPWVLERLWEPFFTKGQQA